MSFLWVIIINSITQCKGGALYRDLSEFCKFTPRNKCIMSIDMGEKYVGIAFSDKTQLVATAHSVYCRQNINKDIGYFYRKLKENEVGAIVIGLPLEMNGFENQWCAKVIQFSNKIVKKCKINVYLQDERFSTSIAKYVLKRYGASIEKSRRIEDKVSACIILQKTLDSLNGLSKVLYI